MSKTKSSEDENLVPDPEIQAMEEMLEPVAAEAGVTLPFTREDWNGVKVVFKCVQCGGFRNTPAEMIDHLISHYPKPAPAGLRETLEPLFKEN